MALIQAGLDLFGRHGFEASSIRQIAQTAGVNSAGIAYHFGGKGGLREACAQAVAETIRQRLLDGGAPQPVPVDLQPDAALEAMLTIVTRATAFIVRSRESEAIARFVVREMMEPSPAFEILYGGLVGPVHGHLCRLWAAATGLDAESERTRIGVFAMIGQLLYFRLARPAVTRRMGWDGIGEAEAEAIACSIRAAVAATILSARGEDP